MQLNVMSFRETISIKYLKKNPHAFSDRLLIEMFTADIRPNEADPILEALGGRKWLDSRRHTRKTDHRTTKKCMACEKREPDVKLSQCSMYTCSIPWTTSSYCEQVDASTSTIGEP
jgi:hypothetical protein